MTDLLTRDVRRVRERIPELGRSDDATRRDCGDYERVNRIVKWSHPFERSIAAVWSTELRVLVLPSISLNGQVFAHIHTGPSRGLPRVK